jgi:hypothetical protein
VIDVDDFRFHNYLGVYFADVIGSRDRFWDSVGCISFREHCLSLQV